MNWEVESKKIVLILLLFLLFILLTSGMGSGVNATNNQNRSLTINMTETNTEEGLAFKLNSLDSKIKEVNLDIPSKNLKNSSYYFRNAKNNDDSNFLSSSNITKLSPKLEMDTTTSKTNYYPFSRSTVYAKNTTSIQNPNYTDGDDIYKLKNIKQTFSLSNRSEEVQILKENIKYIDHNVSEFGGSRPIIESADSKLDISDEIITPGGGKFVLNLTKTQYQIWEDHEFSQGYTSSDNGQYGEPIYAAHGDGNVDPGADRRITDVRIYSGEDHNPKTVDLKLGEMTLVETNDPDIGVQLENFSTGPTLNEIDPNGDKKSPVGELGEDDILVIDTTRDGSYDPELDIALNGNVDEGTQYNTSNLEGKWKYGVYEGDDLIGAYESVIFDRNNDESGSVNLFVTSKGMVFGTNGIYYQRTGSIRYFDTTEANSNFKKGKDGLFVDIGNDGVSTGSNLDLRLTIYKERYNRNSIVNSTDLDANISVTDFKVDDKLIDLNRNGDLDFGEPIIRSPNSKLDPKDRIRINQTYSTEKISSVAKNPNSIIVTSSKNGYNNGDELIKLISSFDTSSKGYTTDNQDYGDNFTLATFSSPKDELMAHKSNSSNYRDSNEIFKIKAVDSSFSNNLSHSNPLSLKSFNGSFGYVSSHNNSSTTDLVYKENDAAAAGPDTYGDRLTAVTVTTNGTLGDKYVKSIRLRKNGTSIATATDPSPNGTWVLQPDPEAAWFGPDGNGRTFSLRASIAEDAPGGQSLALDVPSVEDADGDGAYDPGDRGLFLAQGEPVGDVGPGETLRTEVEQTAETGPPPIGLSVAAPSGNVSAAADTISIDVRGNRSGRQLTAALRALDGTGTTGQKTVTLDADGRATVEFEAEPGRYRVAVAAVTGVGNDTSSIFRVRPAGSVSIVSRTDAVERGDRARFGIGLAHAETARIELRASNGTVLERAVLRRTNGSSPFDVAVATDGNGGPRAGPGFRLEDANGTGGPLEWIAAANPRPRNESGTPSSVNATPQKAGKNRPKTPGANESPSRSAGNNVTGPVSDRLPAGTYSLFVEAAHGQNASTTFRVGASWSATVTPLVAPRDVPLEDAADVRAHATERDAIATGDRLVVAIDTGELEGYRGPIGVGGPPPHAASPGRPTGNGIRRSDAAENRSGGGPPAFVSVGPASGPGPGRNATELRRIEANDSDRFYVVMPDGVEVGPGSRLEAAMVLTEETPLVASVPNRTATESTNVSVRVREAEATLEGVENGSLDLPADPSVSIGGSTTVAPGTTATVHIEGANGSLDRERTVTVSDGGTYETTANLSGYESGTEYTVAVTADGERLSPLRSGSFLGEDTSMAAAGGGGGGGGAVYGSDSDETGDGEPVTVTATPTRTTESDPLPNPPELPDEAFERAWSRVPEPLRLGLPALLISGLGSLAVITIGRGILRLLRP